MTLAASTPRQLSPLAEVLLEYAGPALFAGFFLLVAVVLAVDVIKSWRK